MNKEPEKDRPKFNSVWLAVGIGAGTAIGVALKSLAIGVGIGAAIGVALGLLIPGKKE